MLSEAVINQLINSMKTRSLVSIFALSSHTPFETTWKIWCVSFWQFNIYCGYYKNCMLQFWFFFVMYQSIGHIYDQFQQFKPIIFSDITEFPFVTLVLNTNACFISLMLTLWSYYVLCNDNTIGLHNKIELKSTYIFIKPD